ncbi:hypothetical protein EYY90_11900 [Hafnia alvei]|nr:hypothetical protein EYY90_11900 [Hafnia alvei]
MVSPIQGAPNSAGTSLYRRLSLPRLKQFKENKKIENIFCLLSFVFCLLSFVFCLLVFGLFRHVVLQLNGGM